MTTYKTYQEAKIAMPEACIVEDTDTRLFFGVPTREGTTLAGGSRFAEPQYYCVTVEKFLADGNKFSEGDIYLDVVGNVSYCDDEFPPFILNEANHRDSERYILRAAALEEEKPRTKVEYVKCNFSREWEAVRYYNEEGELFVIDCNGNYSNVNDISGAWYEAVCKNYHCIYRRIETPMTEREEFVEAACSEVNATLDSDAAEDFGKIFESGKFKLVNHDSNRLKDKIRAVAEWEMNTSNDHDWESVAESIYCAVDNLLKS